MTNPAPGDFPEMTLYQAQQRHLRDCGTCQDAVRTGHSTFNPNVGFTKAGYCAEWFEIAQEYADWEGMVNADTLISVERFIDERKSQ